MAVIDQKEYLKKYLGLGDSKDAKKKKKKKKHAAIVGRCKIVDDELGIPIVSVGDDDGVAADFDDVLAAPDELPQIAAIIDERPPELREAEFSNSDRWARVGASNFASGDGEAVNGERFHPSDRKTRDSNASLLRSRKGRESDASPGGRQRPVSDESPEARGKNDSDASPPRARQRHDSDASPPRARQRHDSDASPPRARRRHDSDASPPRERQAPVRNSSLSGRRSHTSPARRRRRHDSDASPPRKSRRQSPDGNDSDLSPPRIPEPIVMDFPLVQVKEEPLSPSSSPRASRRSSARDEKGRRTKTMDGKRAGLQSRDILREENEAAREREKAAIIAAGEAVTGKDAKTVVRRNRKEEERQRKKEEKAARKAIVAAKYQEWSAGVATTQQRQQQAADIAHEMSKPLARYADDEDLERSLKERERADDPMLEYMRKKKLEKLKETNPGYVERPKYKPPPQPPINRYNIWPGYRWDGVDRSNGFENDFFSKQASRKAQQEEAYKWSVEDM